MEQKNDQVTKWLALIVVIVGTFMSVLDSSIVNVALPKMMAVFGADLDSTKWIITAYSLTIAAVIPVTGYLCEVFGSKKVYIFALGVFTIGSLLCGFAGSIKAMIIFRILQAIGGGMIMPVGMAMILQLFTLEERGMAFGYWGIAAMAAPTLGPTLGGFIVQYMDWRLIFNVNIPIGVMGVILAMILLKDSGEIKLKKIDIIGFLSSTVGLVSLLYVLGEGSTIDWSKIEYPILMTLGIGCMIIFIVNELAHPDPLLDLRILKIKSFALSQIISCILMLGLMGGTYVLPLFFQNIRGYSAMQTGLVMMPSAIVMSFMMPISPKLTSKFGIKPVVILGLALMGYSSYEMALGINLNTPKSAFIYYTVLRSFGLGLAMMPINTFGLAEITGPQSGRATALSNTIKQISGALSVTLMTTIIQHNLNVNYAQMAQQVTPFNQYIAGFIGQMQHMYMSIGMTTLAAKASAVSMIGGLVSRSAYVMAMSQATGVMATATIVAILLTFLIKENKNAPKSETPMVHGE